MNATTLLERLTELADDASDAGLRDLVLEALGNHREETAASLQEILGQLSGPLRKRLLECLVEDGGDDLLPLYIITIQKEPNLLQAKSALFSCGNFESQAALEALLALEEDIRPELAEVWKRITGGLKAKFVEHTTMWLFKTGNKNKARLDAAAKTMIEQPHPSYLPFLSQMIQRPEFNLRDAATRVLRLAGNRTSMAMLFQMLPRTFDETRRCEIFYKFLVNPAYAGAKSLNEYMDQVGEKIGWEDETKESLIQEIRREKTFNAIRKVQEGFEVPGNDFWDEASQFLRWILLNKDRDEKMRNRLEEALETLKRQQYELAEAFCRAMGAIGRREEVPNLLARFQAQLPEEQELADVLLVNFLTEYRGEDALKLLLDFLDPKKPQSLLFRVMEALHGYTLEKVPRPLLDLIMKTTDLDLRRKAFDLMVTCGGRSEVLEELFEHKSIDLRGEAVAMVVTHRIESAYPLMLEQLGKKMPNPLLEKFIAGLGFFQKPDHAAALAAFLRINWPTTVRDAAIKSMLASTDPRRLDLIIAMLMQYQPRTRLEMVEILIKHLNNPAIVFPENLTDQMGFFIEALSERHEPVRVGTLEMLEKVDWRRAEDRKGWSRGVKIAGGKYSEHRSDDEKERLEALRHKIDSTQDQPAEPEAQEGAVPKGPAEKVLAPLLDKLEQQQDPGRILRQLNLFFKPSMLTHEPSQWDRLRALVVSAGQAVSGRATETKLLKTVLGKIGDAGLVQDLAVVLTAEARETPAQPLTPKPKPKSEQPPRSEPSPPKPAPAKSDSGSLVISKILLVDDSVVYAKALSKMLTDVGFQVISVTEPSKALTQLQKQPFDLLITDFTMPGLTGLELLEEARRLNNCPPKTMFITSSRDPNELKAMVGAGVDALLLKPFTSEEMLAKVRELAT